MSEKPKYNLMVCGTMSSVGKSMVTAGLCRIFLQDGFQVAPFKSQNMALNSFVTKDGLEMGRAQVMQAQAAGEKPVVAMNPILLKPTGDRTSQVIVNGEVVADMDARTYFAKKTQYIPAIRKAYDSLLKDHDIIVIEGAGSPAEINLKENDIVNLGMAELVDAPVILVADIDRGGVFAQLYGTVMLLSEAERSRIRGMVINKFRGDASLLDSGVEQIEKLLGIPVVGLVPYMDQLCLPDEDSLSERFHRKSDDIHDGLRIAVIRYPRISNFTDFDAFEQYENVSVAFVRTVEELTKARPDVIILPGSKHTVSDLQWLLKNGFDQALKEAFSDVPLIGICGGLEMLGTKIVDAAGVEGQPGTEQGLGLLPVATEMAAQKTRRQVTVRLPEIKGCFAGLSGMQAAGYEIHNGRIVGESGSFGGTIKTSPASEEGLVREQSESAVIASGRVLGTFLHGLFDQVKLRERFLMSVADCRGKADFALSGGRLPQDEFVEMQFDRLAAVLREHLAMEEIYRIMGMDAAGCIRV